MRSYIMEFIGTFFLTIAIIFAAKPLAIGLMLMAMIYVGGHISGGHFNPALSLAALMRNKLRVDEFFIYAAVQSIGACAAIWLFKGITTNVFVPDVPEFSLPLVIGMETLLTFVFAWVFLTLTTTKLFKGNMLYGFVIGLTLAAITYVSPSGFFNPAVGIGSLCCQLFFEDSAMLKEMLFIYIGGPLVGGAVAFFTFMYLNPKEKSVH